MTQEAEKIRMDPLDMQLLLRGMPVRSVKLPTLSGYMLQAMANRRKPSSPGADKIILQMLRALPSKAWEELSEILESIEEGEEWPEELRSILLVPIPKGHETMVAHPEKARLIALTGMIFRVWSSTRRRTCQRNGCPP